MEVFKRVLKDLKGQKNEAERMRLDRRIEWKLRGWYTYFEYWTVSSFPLVFACLIWAVTGDYWKGLAFYFVCHFHHLSANIRGLTLHLENTLEAALRKVV